jgi:hypothetical protein
MMSFNIEGHLQHPSNDCDAFMNGFLTWPEEEG